MQQGVANDLSRGAHPSPGPIPFTQIKCCRTIQNHKNALRLLFSQRTQINPCLQGNSNQIGLVFTWPPALRLVSPFWRSDTIGTEHQKSVSKIKGIPMIPKVTCVATLALTCVLGSCVKERRGVNRYGILPLLRSREGRKPRKVDDSGSIQLPSSHHLLQVWQAQASSHHLLHRQDHSPAA